MPTAGTETYLEGSEGLLGIRGPWLWQGRSQRSQENVTIPPLFHFIQLLVLLFPFIFNSFIILFLLQCFVFYLSLVFILQVFFPPNHFLCVCFMLSLLFLVLVCFLFFLV